MKTFLKRCLWLLFLAALVAGGIYLFHPRNWTYYTDGLAIQQSAKDAEVRIILWEDPEPLEHGINDLPNNIEPVISTDGRQLVFARGKAKENVDLFYAVWDGIGWSDPVPMENVNTADDELGPELNADGTLLYFYSDRPGGSGAYDIWASAWSGSFWDKPVNLGTNVNSAFNEYDPAMAPGDDRLIFSSNRPLNPEDEGPARAAWKATLRELVDQKDYDIFISPKSLVQPEASTNAPPPNWSPEANRVQVPTFDKASPMTALNTPFDEGQVDFTRRGDFVYFSSNREGGLGGFDIYRSRIFHGETLPPERVGLPVSTAFDDMDPTLWLEGHSLVFSSNRESDSGQDFILYHTVSREVISKFENAKLALLWEWIKHNVWWVLALVLSLLALVLLIWLLRKTNLGRELSLLARCVIGSVLVHLLLLFLLSLWFLSAVIIDSTKGPMRVEVNDAALAREKMSLELREEVTELKAAQSEVPMEKRTEKTALSEFSPVKKPMEFDLPNPTPSEFVIEHAAPAEPVPVEETPPLPDALSKTLPTVEFADARLLMETPENQVVKLEEKPIRREAPEPAPHKSKEAAPSPRPVEKADIPEIEIAVQKKVVELDTPFEPEAIPDRPLPDVEFAEALPTLEEMPIKMLLETPDNKPLPVEKEPRITGTAEVDVEKRQAALAARQARQARTEIERVETQQVARVTFEAPSPTPPALPEEAFASAGAAPPKLEDAPIDTAFHMEMPKSSPVAPPSAEPRVAKSRPAPKRDEAKVAAQTGPLKQEIELASAAFPVPDPLTGITPSPVKDLPELLDLPADREFLRTELPEVHLGSNIALETKPLTRMTYILRDPEVRKKLIEQLGGNDDTEAAIARALQYFMRTQEPDGQWKIAKYGGEAGHEVAATGLAMLCFMGHGATHTEKGPYQDNLRRASAWLVKHQREDGAFNGKDMYDHGIGTIALAEAYALTRDKELEEPVRKAVEYIVLSQHPTTGGWRYGPRDPGDTSVFGWELMALKSAIMAGLDVPEEALAKATIWLDKVGGGKQGGLYGYTDRSPKPGMVAEGMFCRQLLGVEPNDARMKESAAYLNTHLPHAGRKDYYFWYYGCLSLYQHKGPVWESWNERMREILVQSQDRDGPNAGSWTSSGDPHGNRMGRIVATALATLSLEVYYRYLPMYGGLEDTE